MALDTTMSRPTAMKALTGAAGLACIAPGTVLARRKPVEPPSVITTPPREFGPNAPPHVSFVDPDVITVDPSFIGADHRASGGEMFTGCTVDGVKCGPDGLRSDVEGNLWASSNAGRSVGDSGVTVWNPEGKLIGRIRLPEVCGHICFGGPKRNRLFMAASQSLYAVDVSTPGAGPG